LVINYKYLFMVEHIIIVKIIIRPVFVNNNIIMAINFIDRNFKILHFDIEFDKDCNLHFQNHIFVLFIHIEVNIKHLTTMPSVL
jgi:hypothetical protein